MHFPKQGRIRAQCLLRKIDNLKEASMGRPVQFTLTHLSPAQRARVIALLVQMILHQLSQTKEAKPDDTLHH